MANKLEAVLHPGEPAGASQQVSCSLASFHDGGVLCSHGLSLQYHIKPVSHLGSLIKQRCSGVCGLYFYACLCYLGREGILCTVISSRRVTEPAAEWEGDSGILFVPAIVKQSHQAQDNTSPLLPFRRETAFCQISSFVDLTWYFY